jgi:hypothetical protein
MVMLVAVAHAHDIGDGSPEDQEFIINFSDIS